MNQLKLSTPEGLVMFLILSTAQAALCPPCSCAWHTDKQGWILDCSSLGLKEMPLLSHKSCPSCNNLRILRLQNNSITSMPVGALDYLINLREADFSNNPWHCDCSILYFKQWLEDSSQVSLAKVTCTSPAFVKTKTLGQLNGNELEGCRKPLPIKCLDFFWRDFALIFMVMVSLFLAYCILHHSKKLASQIAKKRHSVELPLLPIHDLENQKSK